MPKKESALKKKFKQLTGQSAPTEQDEKKAQASVLKARNDLLACMEQVRFVSPGGEISQEFLDSQKLRFRGLMMTLDNLKTANTMDTKVYDQQLIVLCDDLQQALIDGDEASAKYIMMAFEYGIRVGHKPLLKSEQERSELVTETRRETMDNYRQLCAKSVDLFKEHTAVKELNKRFKELGERYSEQMTKTLHYIDTHKDLHQQILQLGGDLKKMNPAQFKLAMMEQEVLRLDNSLDQIVIKQGIHQGTINSLQSALDTLYTAVKDYNNLLQEELVEFINNLSEKETIRITQGIIQIDDLNTAIKNLHNVYMNAFQTPRVQQMMVSTAIEFEELRSRHEAEKDAFGRNIFNEEFVEENINEEEIDLINQ